MIIHSCSIESCWIESNFWHRVVSWYIECWGLPSDQSKICYEKERNKHVICTKRKRPGACRVRDHSCARRHRCHCSHAFAWTQDRQYLQYYQPITAVICSYLAKKAKKGSVFEQSPFDSIYLNYYFNRSGILNVTDSSKCRLVTSNLSYSFFSNWTVGGY